jgi:hypothetical protein
MLLMQNHAPLNHFAIDKLLLLRQLSPYSSLLSLASLLQGFSCGAIPLLSQCIVHCWQGMQASQQLQ